MPTKKNSRFLDLPDKNLQLPRWEAWNEPLGWCVYMKMRQDENGWDMIRNETQFPKGISMCVDLQKGYKKKRTEVPFCYPAIPTVTIRIITTSMTSSISLSKNAPKKGDSFSKAIIHHSLVLFSFKNKLFVKPMMLIWPVSFLTTPPPSTAVFFDCTWSLDGLDPNLKKTRDGHLIWQRFFRPWV